MGLLETPEEEKINTPEDEDWLNEIYNRLDRQDLPAEYDSVTEGL
jgi:hypothetical protein